MRISSSTVGMESSRQYTSSLKYAGRVSVTNAQIMAVGAQATSGSTYEGKSLGQVLSGKATEEESLKDSLLGMSQRYYSISQIKNTTEKTPEELVDEIRVRTITFLLNLLGGSRKHGISSENEEGDSLIDKLFEDMKSGEQEISSGEEEEESDSLTNSQETTDADLNFAMTSSSTLLYQLNLNTISFQEHYSYAESESTGFKSQGSVVTADGREISFGIDMEMSRSFTEEYDINVIRKNASFCDPLVINLDGNVAQVSDQKFLFDIDHDGIAENISQLSEKSGYLALDLNEDGKINDGSELFGTSSGDGFKDLAKYDSDGDGWIDEDDEVWSKLLIWSKDEKGNDALYHLTEKGVGAISLQNTATDFSLNSSETNEVNAKIRKTGIFLYENGNVGTVQHLDLAK